MPVIKLTTHSTNTISLNKLLSSAALTLLCPNILFASNQNLEIQNLYSLSLEDILNTPITTSSFFTETDLDSGSTVTIITNEYWNERGARRLDDALMYMPSVAILPTFVGTSQWAIRGYPNAQATGIQTLWDGVPINAYPTGSAQADHVNIQLSTLNSIEVIRGPGSALYGSDAMHGVVSLKAYEAKQNEQIGTIRAGADGYYEGSIRSSYLFSDNWRANFALASNGQPDQDKKYEYLASGIPTFAERDYNYSTSTTSLILKSDSKKQLSHKVSFFYNKYDHDGFYHNGTDVPSNDTSTVDTYLGILKAETKFKLNSSQNFTFNISGWEYDRHFSRILRAALNFDTINIFATEKQTAANIIYTDEKTITNTELSLALGRKTNDTGTSRRVRVTSTGTQIFDLPLLFSDKGRTINSFLLDGKTRFTEGKNILRYGFRYDDYSDFGEQVTPRIGYIHYINKKEVVKVLYGNSFRAATGNELYGGPQQTGDINLQPEELDTIEFIYIKKQHDSKTEATLFYSELTNGIRLIDTDNNNIPDAYANVSKSDSTGIELSYVKQFSSWGLDTNGSYIISHNQTDDVALTIFPAYIFNISLHYKFFTKWALTVSNRIEAKRTRTPTTPTISPDNLPDYFRTDLTISKDYTKNIKVFLNIRNLFNRDNQSPSTQDSSDSDDFTTGIQDEETKLDIGLHIRF